MGRPVDWGGQGIKRQRSYISLKNVLRRRYRPIHSGSYEYELYKTRNTGASFFSEHVINIWNKLPDAVNFCPVKAFKRSSRRIL